MNIKKTGIILFIAAAFMVITPVNAQTATFDSVTSPETVQPGEVVTVDLVISYDFDSLTTISPGVYDPITDSYLVEDGLDVSGAGTGSISLSFDAPTIDGEYVFIVDLYAQDGTDWVYTGQDDYYITLTVGAGGSTPTASAIVKDIQHPNVVKPGAPMEIKVTIEYDFAVDTNMEVAVSDPETMTAIETASAVKNGAGTDEFKITIYAPEQEGTYTLGADVIFETNMGWEFSSGGAMAFTFDVDSIASSGGIPSFPMASVVLGALVVIALMQYNGRKTPIF